MGQRGGGGAVRCINPQLSAPVLCSGALWCAYLTYPVFRRVVSAVLRRGVMTPGLVARNDMVTQYDGSVVASLFVQRIESLVEQGKRKADEEVAAAEAAAAAAGGGGAAGAESTSEVVQGQAVKRSTGAQAAAIRAEDLPLRRSMIQQRKQQQQQQQQQQQEEDRGGEGGAEGGARITLASHSSSDRWR
jgi:hypothetical protein